MSLEDSIKRMPPRSLEIWYSSKTKNYQAVYNGGKFTATTFAEMILILVQYEAEESDSFYND